ncbi:U4 U6.U5 tri-snRNP-associated protein [Linderina macrospora]|uniref:U4 U6.U5 tri-snRNP-associated protein n=1 Tax=Linderina macrospora TaxID=4868 RepID=A0ACC1JHG8_9FUNG|nr:U4 U6.U5 tri-snRNP-associated protein [Linderina macrospora]
MSVHKRPADESPEATTPSKVQRTHSSNALDSDSEDEYLEDTAQPTAVIEGLYLDTVNRASLDFDFEKLCSVSLSNNNVYACLVCGKYYQGRGKQTHAFFHSINDDHHVFINLKTLKVYVLPDNYEVHDRSLNDIKANVQPQFTKEQVDRLDTVSECGYDLGGKKFVVGFTGLNKIKCNDYMNVVVQALAHVPPIRNELLLMGDLDSKPELVQRMASLVRKMWHAKPFKSHASPHEFVQEVVARSKKRFRLDVQGDAFEFLMWLLNTLHIDLGGTKKRTSSVIYRTFQGEVEVETQKVDKKQVQSRDGGPVTLDASKEVQHSKTPFLTLSFDLPPKPLFTGDDDESRVNIPQIALTTLLHRYDGSTVVELNGSSKRYWLQKLPNYIICHVKRFSRNDFSVEKNPTVVNFPIRNVSFGDLLPKDTQARLTAKGHSGTYDLIANICHDGQPAVSGNGPVSQHPSASASTNDDAVTSESQYLVYLRHTASDQWYLSRDLQMERIMPQMIFLSDTYIQIWQRNGV